MNRLLATATLVVTLGFPTLAPTDQGKLTVGRVVSASYSVPDTTGCPSSMTLDGMVLQGTFNFAGRTFVGRMETGATQGTCLYTAPRERFGPPVDDVYALDAFYLVGQTSTQRIEGTCSGIFDEPKALFLDCEGRVNDGPLGTTGITVNLDTLGARLGHYFTDQLGGDPFCLLPLCD